MLTVEMIKFSLMRIHPELSIDEIEKLAIDELKDIYEEN